MAQQTDECSSVSYFFDGIVTLGYGALSAYEIYLGKIYIDISFS